MQLTLLRSRARRRRSLFVVTIERVFDPIYADFCEEYFAALDAGEKWHAHWIRVRFYKDFVKVVGLFGVVRLAKTVFAYWEKIA